MSYKLSMSFINLKKSISRWEFYSENSDIAFAVYRKESKMIPIIPPSRVDCHVSTVIGQLNCEQPGLCKCH